MQSNLLRSLNPSKCALLLSSILLLVIWLASGQIISDLQQHGTTIILLVREHLALTILSGGAAIILGVPLGIWLHRPSQARTPTIIMRCVYITMIIPALTLLTLALGLLGKGTLTAIAGLWLVTLPPIVYTTHAGLSSVPNHLKEAAIGMGLPPMQILRRVELPIALFWILTGIRLALVINIAATALAFLVGAGGLGRLLIPGIQSNDMGMLLSGALPLALLAIIVDFLAGLVIRYWVSPGINPLSATA